MRLVIEISYQDYGYVKDGRYANYEMTKKLYGAVSNGEPLPEEPKDGQRLVDQDLIDLVSKAYTEGDPDEKAAYLAEVLMDDSISTYGMFDALASAFANGRSTLHSESEQNAFRLGLDTAVSYITGRDMAELSKTVVETCKESEPEEAER